MAEQTRVHFVLEARIQRFIGYIQLFALEKLFHWHVMDFIATGWLSQRALDDN